MLLIGYMVMTLGILGSAIAWNYGSSLVFRLLTGISGGMVLPNYFAIIADVFLEEGRGKAIGWTLQGDRIRNCLRISHGALPAGSG
jgi:predicted MFS family arabinose efflux permease